MGVCVVWIPALKLRKAAQMLIALLYSRLLN